MIDDTTDTAPTTTVLALLSSLLAQTRPEDVLDAVARLDPDDLADLPAHRAVLTAIARAARSGTVGPDLLYDRLREAGALAGPAGSDVAAVARDAVTAGADRTAVRPLVDAVLRDSERRRAAELADDIRGALTDNVPTGDLRQIIDRGHGRYQGARGRADTTRDRALKAVGA